jgi:hypothetical protein
MMRLGSLKVADLIGGHDDFLHSYLCRSPVGISNGKCALKPTDALGFSERHFACTGSRLHAHEARKALREGLAGWALWSPAVGHFASRQQAIWRFAAAK